MKTMSGYLCVTGSSFGSEEQPGCDGCYLISLTSLIAIITSDIILTIFIIISVFCFATHQRRRRERDSLDAKKNSPLSTTKKVPTEVTESPYQELHGVQSDVYSELRHFRK
ncbi:TYRO protein tyrosine kinase-binding protein [Oryzias melastigma]|uniref:TYRO protein tyrosine kinase-binding protein n=1 Tax=Oryzias melastigma TaxID=30732 RepID=A0A834FT24_ORYME|nr:TYRO protein tyrosine kinase-binding protein [Oryzias melastigma]KAF6739685.1 TYRO protein tyrosine kinase-binding protein [Oryzias melastigma]